jgi:hypothetical protein
VFEYDVVMENIVGTCLVTGSSVVLDADVVVDIPSYWEA